MLFREITLDLCIRIKKKHINPMYYLRLGKMQDFALLQHVLPSLSGKFEGFL
jgi:hypothetical protein